MKKLFILISALFLTTNVNAETLRILAEAGDEDVFRKLKEDLENYNIEEHEIRSKMKLFYEKAKEEFK